MIINKSVSCCWFNVSSWNQCPCCSIVTSETSETSECFRSDSKIGNRLMSLQFYQRRVSAVRETTTHLKSARRREFNRGVNELLCHWSSFSCLLMMSQWCHTCDESGSRSYRCRYNHQCASPAFLHWKWDSCSGAGRVSMICWTQHFTKLIC